MNERSVCIAYCHHGSVTERSFYMNTGAPLHGHGRPLADNV
jgi:hypothetical protein